LVSNEGPDKKSEDVDEEGGSSGIEEDVSVDRNTEVEDSCNEDLDEVIGSTELNAEERDGNSPQNVDRLSSPQKFDRLSSHQNTFRLSSPQNTDRLSSPRNDDRLSSPQKFDRLSSHQNADRLSNSQDTDRLSSPRNDDRLSSHQNADRHDVQEVEVENQKIRDSQELVQSQDMFLEDSIILDSDEEWCDDCTKVNNLEVMNFSHPKDCSSRGLEPPSKYLGALFRPVVCSLNNKINFVAISGKTYQHKTEIDRFCGLQPACPVRFGEGTVIARVYIMETISHPRNNAEDWVCAHHGIASVKGFQTPDTIQD